HATPAPDRAAACGAAAAATCRSPSDRRPPDRHVATVPVIGRSPTIQLAGQDAILLRSHRSRLRDADLAGRDVRVHHAAQSGRGPGLIDNELSGWESWPAERPGAGSCGDEGSVRSARGPVNDFNKGEVMVDRSTRERRRRRTLVPAAL